MKKIIVLNHKMNLYYEELYEYIDRINKLEHNLIIAPSNIYLLEFKNKCKHHISSQDICYIEEGNYTSKVSWHQIKSIGINYSIIGHSEKDENLDKTNVKLKICLKHNIKPILCFGNEQESIELLEKLLIDIPNIENIIFAYEPMNKSIDINKLTKEINLIYNYLFNKYQTKPTLLYGGGINNYNINEMYDIEHLQGILIGSISSDINEIEKILNNVSEKY